MFSGDAGSGVTVGGTGFTVGGTGFTDGGSGFTVGGTGFTDGGTGLVGVGGVGGLGGIGNSNGCPPGQFKLANGVCGCPVFAPNYCAAMGKCVNFTKAPETCGSCEHACGSTQACVDSACTPELVQLTELADCGSVLLVYANATLYALSTGVGELSSVPVAGGAPSMIASGLSDPDGSEPRAHYLDGGGTRGRLRGFGMSDSERPALRSPHGAPRCNNR